MMSDAPKHPEYATERSRLNSFREWGPARHQSARDFAEAGFIHAGMNDSVICFHCDGELSNWLPEEVPWVEHARWFPQCSHVRFKKGQHFIETVNEVFPRRVYSGGTTGTQSASAANYAIETDDRILSGLDLETDGYSLPTVPYNSRSVFDSQSPQPTVPYNSRSVFDSQSPQPTVPHNSMSVLYPQSPQLTVPHNSRSVFDSQSLQPTVPHNSRSVFDSQSPQPTVPHNSRSVFDSQSPQPTVPHNSRSVFDSQSLQLTVPHNSRSVFDSQSLQPSVPYNSRTVLYPQSSPPTVSYSNIDRIMGGPEVKKVLDMGYSRNIARKAVEKYFQQGDNGLEFTAQLLIEIICNMPETLLDTDVLSSGSTRVVETPRVVETVETVETTQAVHPTSESSSDGSSTDDPTGSPNLTPRLTHGVHPTSEPSSDGSSSDVSSTEKPSGFPNLRSDMNHAIASSTQQVPDSNTPSQATPEHNSTIQSGLDSFRDPASPQGASYEGSFTHTVHHIREIDLHDAIVSTTSQGPESSTPSNLATPEHNLTLHPQSRLDSFSNPQGASSEASFRHTDVETLRKENRELVEQTLCNICLVNKRCIIFLPCGHLVSCSECAAALQTCPICGKKIKGKFKAVF